MKIIAWPRKLQLRGHSRSYGTLQAGNSVSRVFDWDLAASADEPVQAQTFTVPFLPRWPCAC